LRRFGETAVGVMESRIDRDVPIRKPGARRVNRVRVLIKFDDGERSRRATEDLLSQRLFSIVLAVHAAEVSLAENPARLGKILELIQVQSAASQGLYKVSVAGGLTGNLGGVQQKVRRIWDRGIDEAAFLC
jgi:hypothetical protein